METTLGKQVTITCKYKRVRTYIDKKRWKVWETEPLKRDMVGIVVGVRTISNGVTDFDSEAGYYYTPKLFMRALLVSYSLNRSPILVPF